MKPGDLVQFVGDPGAFDGTWAELLLPDNLVDDAWLPPDTPPGIYLGRHAIAPGTFDAEVLVNGQVYVVRHRLIERARS